MTLVRLADHLKVNIRSEYIAQIEGRTAEVCPDGMGNSER